MTQLVGFLLCPFIFVGNSDKEYSKIVNISENEMLKV